MQRSLAAVLALACAAGLAWGQPSPDSTEWKELDAPPPPALRARGLLAFDVQGTSLRFGIDPDSIRIGADKVVRYVVVATSQSGVVNAFYEGVRCETAEVKTYARHNPDTGWVPAKGADWHSLHTLVNSRHSLALARGGICAGKQPNASVQDIVRDLRFGANDRSVN